MLAEILALILALLLLLFLFRHRFIKPKVRRSFKPASNEQHNAKTTSISEDIPLPAHTVVSGIHPFHSVEIVDDSGLCKNAQALKGKRYLSHEAPTLPLAGCSGQDCECRYIHHEDRRNQHEERRLDFGVTHELYGAFGETNRRALRRKGRRETDRQSSLRR
ncbi:hypothetical protein [Shewanella colwelliana]|uniref:hypothetical protein n=1 Tax=Shewanella colwelliana TaxID=23 RepID=UPI0004B099B5|nr:hypothetical protein [Shewanella colwelliana]